MGLKVFINNLASFEEIESRWVVLSASLKFVRSNVEKPLLLTYEKISIYRIPNYLHSLPA